MQRVGMVVLTVLVVVCGLAGLAVIAAPFALAGLLSIPATPSAGLQDGVGEHARTIAYSLRNSEARAAMDHGASRARIAGLAGMVPATTERLRAIGTDSGPGEAVLLRAERVGSTGSAVEFAEGGIIGGGVEFGPPERPWVTCLRVELPETALDATAWTVRDVDCPTFNTAVRKDAARVHAHDFTSTPLLRPPCYGTTGYCPGG